MDMMEQVTKVVSSLKGDKNLLSAFAGDPAKIVKSILGIDLSDEMLGKIIDEVKKQLGNLLGGDALKGAADAAADAAKDAARDGAGGILGKLKNLF